jgi:hypothetical protein
MADRDGQFRDTLDTERPGERVDDSRGRSPAGRVRTRVRDGVRSVATARGLAVALAVVAAGALLAGQVLPAGVVGDLLGVLLGAFLYGIVSGTRRYVEVAVAGVVVGGLAGLLGTPGFSLASLGVPTAVFGGGAGALAAVAGHYLGRDLRNGLTRDL